MSAFNVLAGVAVNDLEKSVEWYAEVLGRGPDARPMRGLAEWQFDSGGWLQVFRDPERAGRSSITFAEDDFDARVWALKAKGIDVGPTTRSEEVDTAIVHDPDGNRVVFAHGKHAELLPSSTEPSG